MIPWSPQPNPRESLGLLANCPFGRQPLHRAGAAEPVNALATLQDIVRIVRFGNRAAVAQHEYIRADRLGGLGHAIDDCSAVVECLRRLRPDRAGRGQPHMRYEDIGQVAVLLGRGPHQGDVWIVRVEFPAAELLGNRLGCPEVDHVKTSGGYHCGNTPPGGRFQTIGPAGTRDLVARHIAGKSRRFEHADIDHQRAMPAALDALADECVFVPFGVERAEQGNRLGHDQSSAYGG